jgi:hypothetical protein
MAEPNMEKACPVQIVKKRTAQFFGSACSEVCMVNLLFGIWAGTQDSAEDYEYYHNDSQDFCRRIKVSYAPPAGCFGPPIAGLP